MSDRAQYTSQKLGEKMLSRYGTEFHHKHNKYHLTYRKHCKSHPCTPNTEPERPDLEGSTGLVRQLNLKRMRKRPQNGGYH